jgi:hypothetical protein
MGEEKRRREWASKSPQEPKSTDNPGFTILAVGELVPEELRAHIPQLGGCAIALTNDRFFIISAFPGLRPKEANALQNNPIELGIMPHKDALIFTMHVDGYGTFDMPYDHTVVLPSYRWPGERPEGHGSSVTVFGIDSRTKIIRALRYVSVTPEFCDVLDAEIAKLNKRVDAADWSFFGAMKEAYWYWPNSARIAERAIYRETAGMKFPKSRTAPPPPGSH